MERLLSRLKGLHYFICHLSDPVLVLQVMTKCIKTLDEIKSKSDWTTNSNVIGCH